MDRASSPLGGLTLHNLAVFRAVVDSGGVGAAGRRIHLSQPAVSFHLRTLERCLGARLLARSPRGVALTQEGRIVDEWVRRSLTDLDQVLERLQRMDLPDGGVRCVRIAAGTFVARYLAPPWLASFGIWFPEVSLPVHVVPGHRLGEVVRHQEADVAVGIAPSPNEPGVTGVLIAREELVGVVGGGHSGRRSPEVGSLGELPLIGYRRGSCYQRWVEAQMRDMGLRPAPSTMELRSIEAMKRAAMEGLGMAIVFRRAAQRELSRGDLVRVRFPKRFYAPIRLLCRRGRSADPLVAALARVICKTKCGRPAFPKGLEGAAMNCLS